MRILGSASIAVLATMLTGLAACESTSRHANDATTVVGGGDGMPAVELGAAARLDSGNVAYRAKQYEAALGYYRHATERAPGLAAAWFGLYMAETALGNKAAADSAMRKVQELAPGTLNGHPTSGSGTGLPAGHPAIDGATAPAPVHGAPGGANTLPAGHPDSVKH